MCFKAVSFPYFLLCFSPRILPNLIPIALLWVISSLIIYHFQKVLQNIQPAFFFHFTPCMWLGRMLSTIICSSILHFTVSVHWWNCSLFTSWHSSYCFIVPQLSPALLWDIDGEYTGNIYVSSHLWITNSVWIAKMPSVLLLTAISRVFT